MNLVGNKYGNLTVKSISTKKCKKSYYWNCVCDCGKKVKRTSYALRNKMLSSCGCLKGNLPGESAFNRLYTMYINNAKKYKHKFDLDQIIFQMLTSSNCSYCGIKPNNFTNRPNQKEVYYFNGIDRINTKKGYLINNVTPCCTICNRMKLNHKLEYFLKHLYKIYKNKC